MLSSASDSGLVLDAGPLIYLAKLDALDVLDGYRPHAITPAVHREVVRPPAAYRFPEISLIAGAISSGGLDVVTMRDDEQAHTDLLGDQVPGLGTGERETIAVAASRGWSAALFDRRARRVAEANGVPVFGVPTLLFEGTRERGLLVRRIRRFGALVNMRLDDLETLLERIEER